MPRQRKTLTLRIGPEEWDPICKWMAKWLDRVKNPPGLFLEENTRPALDKLIRKARRTKRTDDLTIRLTLEEAEEVRQQMSFWECAQDEITREAREEMPVPEVFATLRWDAAYALNNA